MKTKDITKEMIISLYITQNKRKEDVCKTLGISLKQLSTLLKKLDIKKPKELSRQLAKKTCVDKYGTENISTLPQVKEKIKKTCLAKYGVEVSSKAQSVKDKQKITCLKKYGSSSPLANEEIREKSKKTMQEKYGVDYALQNDQLLEQAHRTNKERYGVSYMLEITNKDKELILRKANYSEESFDILFNKEKFINFLSKRSDKTILDIADELGASYRTVQHRIKDWGLQDMILFRPSSSVYEKELIDILIKMGIKNIVKNDRQVLGDQKEIDIYLPDFNVGIEFNGNYWHSELFKPYEYHQIKSILGLQKGVFIYNIFEYEWNNQDKKEKIISHLKAILHKNNFVIPARKTVIKQISSKEKNAFLKKYHLQSEDKAQIKLGLFFEEELVMVMTFCKDRFGKKCSWELSRLCSKSDTTVIGGAQKIFKFFVKNYLTPGDTIVSYSNIAHTTGNIYPLLGFKKDHISTPNYVWWFPKTEEILSRYQCQMNSENEIMAKNGYVKIYDCGNFVWIYEHTKEEQN